MATSLENLQLATQTHTHMHTRNRFYCHKLPSTTLTWVCGSYRRATGLPVELELRKVPRKESAPSPVAKACPNFLIGSMSISSEFAP